MFYNFFKISKYKNFEIDICSLQHVNSYFYFSFEWSRKQDHAGYHSYISIGRFKFELNIHDIRHWDRVLNRWETLPEEEKSEKEDEWEVGI